MEGGREDARQKSLDGNKIIKVANLRVLHNDDDPFQN